MSAEFIKSCHYLVYLEKKKNLCFDFDGLFAIKTWACIVALLWEVSALKTGSGC